MAESEERPLWMPKGSVRGLIALMLVSTVLASAFMAVTIEQWVVELIIMVVAFYFGARSAEAK